MAAVMHGLVRKTADGSHRLGGSRATRPGAPFITLMVHGSPAPYVRAPFSQISAIMNISPLVLEDHDTVPTGIFAHRRVNRIGCVTSSTFSPIPQFALN